MKISWAFMNFANMDYPSPPYKLDAWSLNVPDSGGTLMRCGSDSELNIHLLLDFENCQNLEQFLSFDFHIWNNRLRIFPRKNVLLS
jgi:hypothetical protein